MSRRFEISPHHEQIWDNETDGPITLEEFVDALYGAGYSDVEILEVLDAIGKYRNEVRDEAKRAGCVTLVIEEPGATGATE
jgi:hypothetical protein